MTDPSDDGFDINEWLDAHAYEPAREELESRDEDWTSSREAA